VNASLAARLPFEVLDRVGQEDRRGVEPCLDHCLAQQLTCRADERLAGEVFVIARLLAHQHQSCARRPRAKHRLGASLPKVTPAAGSSLLSDLRKFLPSRRRRAACFGHSLLAVVLQEVNQLGPFSDQGTGNPGTSEPWPGPP
jgi:hypothetical protein